MEISQREARRLRKRVAELEGIIDAQRRTWARQYPGGVHLGDVVWSADTNLGSAVQTAQLLNHAIVAVAEGPRKFRLYALPVARSTP